MQSNPVFSVKILKEPGKDGRSAIGSEVTTMRKTILGHQSQPATSSSKEWLGVEAIAGIGVTSEAEDAPVENVLYPDREVGWRAGEPGPRDYPH
jgi:hypothetical protein